MLEKLKDLLESAIPSGSEAEYPKEAMKKGTFVRSDRLNKLGIVTDAFYGDLDKDNQKIIIYTVLWCPSTGFNTKISSKKDLFYVSNEYEYDFIGYLMLKPVDLSKLIISSAGELF